MFIKFLFYIFLFQTINYSNLWLINKKNHKKNDINLSMFQIFNNILFDENRILLNETFPFVNNENFSQQKNSWLELTLYSFQLEPINLEKV